MFRDERLSADRITPLERLAEKRPDAFHAVVDLLRGWMVFRDPPAHTRLRDPVRRAFTPRMLDGLAASVSATVDALLDRLIAAGGGNVRDIVTKPLPALVIADLLGVPPEDRDRFQLWSEKLSRVIFSVSSSDRDDAPAIEAAADFTDYFGELITRYRAEPADNLVSAMATESDDSLSDAELIGACTLLLFAGHETTTDLLTSSMFLFCEQPELHAPFLASPHTGVEELLRVAGPAKTMVRRVATDHERAGRQLASGDVVYLVIGAANRDPRVFKNAHEIDPARDPNPHVAFGWGIHHCLGAPLARLEARIALTSFIERCGTAQITSGGTWNRSVLGRAINKLELSI